MKTETKRGLAPAITPLEMTESDILFAERMGAALGFEQMAYTSSSGLWGVFCLPDHAEHKHGCIILTKEFGFMFVADLEDCCLHDMANEERQVAA
jgi:hypothetical protein